MLPIVFQEMLTESKSPLLKMLSCKERIDNFKLEKIMPKIKSILSSHSKINPTKYFL